MFPWNYATKQQEKTPREIMITRLREGVPPDLATRAAGVTLESIKNDPEIDKALAEGEITLFERARDSGVTGTVRAAQRYETNSWTPKAEATIGLTLEDLLRD